MDSGKFEGADFKSDVCQLVSVEHFFLEGHIFMMAAKNKRFLNCFTFRPVQALFASVIE